MYYGHAGKYNIKQLPHTTNGCGQSLPRQYTCIYHADLNGEVVHIATIVDGTIVEADLKLKGA